MPQITIYMDEETAKRAKSAARSAGLSLSKWLARLVEDRTRDRWPESVRALAGAWSDLPTAEELRAGNATDHEREPL